MPPPRSSSYLAGMSNFLAASSAHVIAMQGFEREGLAIEGHELDLVILAALIDPGHGANEAPQHKVMIAKPFAAQAAARIICNCSGVD